MTDAPNWIDSRHIAAGSSVDCRNCGTTLTVNKTARLATWMGVNWEDGYVEHLTCPDCSSHGKLTTKLMNERTGEIRFTRSRAAYPSAAAEPTESYK